MKTIIVLLKLLLIAALVNTTNADQIRDYYAEPGLNPFKDSYGQTINENISPFNGTLQLEYTDLIVPGNPPSHRGETPSRWLKISNRSTNQNRIYFPQNTHFKEKEKL